MSFRAGWDEGLTDLAAEAKSSPPSVPPLRIVKLNEYVMKTRAAGGRRMWPQFAIWVKSPPLLKRTNVAVAAR